MDISSRLKEFLDYTGLQSTQFADTCGIPRPSFSQLLRGRNKKVSDEVITKIHESFPQLSILWLMFGEGDMVLSSNIRISESENAVNPPLYPMQSADDESDDVETDDFYSQRELSQSTNMPPLPGMDTSELTPGNMPFVIPGTSEAKNDTNHHGNTRTYNNAQHDSVSSVSVLSNDANQRRVVSIMVFYSDKSFETFVPEKTK